MGDDLELVNWVNEGLVKISNRFKGKAQMPKRVIYDKKYFTKYPEARAYHDSSNGTIGINKLAYDNIFDDFNKILEQGKVASKKMAEGKTFSAHDLAYSVLDKKITRINEKEIKFNPMQWLDVNLQGSILDKIDKYKTNPKNFSRFDVENIILQIQDLVASSERLFKEPLDVIKNIADKNPEFFKNHGKELSYYENLPKQKQIIHCMSMLSLLSKETNSFCTIAGTHRGGSKFGILWHEMGHLLHNMNTSLKDKFWGVLSQKSENVFVKDGEKLKVAGKISWYAKTNPKEFVAETFSALCSGHKLPDEVMELYKFYKGPILPNM